jgi:uncharacterized protein YfaS (alpha-2-macroglobulin family)
MLLNVTLKARAPLRHVTVEIPLPAGAFPVEPASPGGPLAGAPGTPPGPDDLAARSAWWVSHAQGRPDQVILHADNLGPGDHQTTIALRAGTPGRYQLPSARAFSTYMPDIETRTPSGTLVVVPQGPP